MVDRLLKDVWVEIVCKVGGRKYVLVEFNQCIVRVYFSGVRDCELKEGE